MRRHVTLPADLAGLPPMLTPAQAAAILQLSRRTIVNMCARGDLPSRLIAGGWRINRDELLRMITTAPAR